MKYRVHDKEVCSGTCPFHSPSNHHMVDWPMVLRETTLVERLCEHGVGHPDPDSLSYLDPDGTLRLAVHGCDGCCFDRENTDNES